LTKRRMSGSGWSFAILSTCRRRTLDAQDLNLQNFRQPDARQTRWDQNRGGGGGSGVSPPVARGCGARGGDPASSSTWSMLLILLTKARAGPSNRRRDPPDVGIIDERARATED
jgi:hypothetical protein